MLFVNCLIDNPSFESQSKEELTTKPSQFGSKFVADQQRIREWLIGSGLVDDILHQLDKKKVICYSISVLNISYWA